MGPTLLLLLLLLSCARSETFEPRPPCVCANPLAVCVDGVCTSAACLDGGAGTAEGCNGLDDNCDGQVDEGAPGSGAACDTGLPGRCAPGLTRCEDGALHCHATAARAEACNGEDDDCDGQVDNGLAETACDTGQQGACRAGTLRCVDGGSVCVARRGPTSEICGNGVDDDCNGETDERCDCADGTREAFTDRRRFPTVAGCAGGFTQPGLLFTAAPSCGRGAGNDGAHPDGQGCGAEDLCAAGWHVCRGVADVAARATVCDVPQTPALFFATRQSGSGCGHCASGTETAGCTAGSCAADCSPALGLSNDVFGCGNVGLASASDCGLLTVGSNDLCSSLPAPWTCGSDGNGEAINVTKPGPSGGGVLCCRD
jgi:hypothetical protein